MVIEIKYREQPQRPVITHHLAIEERYAKAVLEAITDVTGKTVRYWMTSVIEYVAPEWAAMVRRVHSTRGVFCLRP